MKTIMKVVMWGTGVKNEKFKGGSCSDVGDVICPTKSGKTLVN